jgi:hypothetical protein
LTIAARPRTHAAPIAADSIIYGFCQSVNRPSVVIFCMVRPSNYGQNQTFCSIKPAIQCVAASMTQISPEHRPLHPPSSSSPSSQPAQLATRGNARLTRQRPQIPTGHHPPRFPSLEVFERRPAEPVAALRVWLAGIRKPQHQRTCCVSRFLGRQRRNSEGTPDAGRPPAPAKFLTTGWYQV